MPGRRDGHSFLGCCSWLRCWLYILDVRPWSTSSLAGVNVVRNAIVGQETINLPIDLLRRNLDSSFDEVSRSTPPQSILDLRRRGFSGSRRNELTHSSRWRELGWSGTSWFFNRLTHRGFAFHSWLFRRNVNDVRTLTD